MARIRTIKPEFPQSESMGRVSRDARLLFVMLWTICDDSGRTRGSSRMLASLLFPYDDDAPKLCSAWLGELVKEGCVISYDVAGDSYLEVANWLKHQRIDKASPSRLPCPREASRTFAKPREHSTRDLGPRTMDLVPSVKENNSSLDSLVGFANAKPKRGTRWPSDAVVSEDWISEGTDRRLKNKLAAIDLRLEVERFGNYWSSKSGTQATKTDWHRTWLNWCINAKGQLNGSGQRQPRDYTGRARRAIAELGPDGD